MQNTTQIIGSKFNELYNNANFYIVTTIDNMCLQPYQPSFICNAQIEDSAQKYTNGLVRKELTVSVSDNPTKKKDYHWFHFSNKENLINIVDPDMHEFAIQISVCNDAIVYINKTNNIMWTNKIVTYKRIHIWSNSILYLPMVMNNPSYFQYVTKYDAITCALLLKHNGLLLQFIDSNFQTKELCEIAINSEPLALEYVNPLLKTHELSKFAVKSNGLTLQYVSNQTEDICLCAIEENYNAFKFVSNKTRRICKQALKKCGMLIKYIDSDLFDIELLEIAVKQNGMALGYIDSNFHSKELYMYAIDQNKNASCFVKVMTDAIYDKIISSEMCSNVIAVNDPIENVNETIEKEKNVSLKYITNQTQELCTKMILDDPNEFKYIDPLLQTDDLSAIVIRKNSMLLEFVNNKTEELCELAVTLNGLSIQFVDNQTPYICKIALQQNVDAIFYIHMRTEEQWKYVLNKKPELSAYIDNKFKYLVSEKSSWYNAKEWYDTIGNTINSANMMVGNKIYNVRRYFQ